MPAAKPEKRKYPRGRGFQTQEAIKLRAGAREMTARVRDVGVGGIGVQVPLALHVGEAVSITGALTAGVTQRTLKERPARVVSCFPLRDGGYAAGLAFTEAAQDQPAPGEKLPERDYYEILQLSPNADPDTIHRVYRLLAQRHHPDNLESGSAERFRDLLEAYRVLSDPAQRAAFDVQRRALLESRWKILDSAGSSGGRELEKRKREGVLALLYSARLNQPRRPDLSIQDLEDLLGCPREHLEFSLWYLKEAGCVVRGDSGRYSITVRGVERAEADEPAAPPPSRLLLAAN